MDAWLRRWAVDLPGRRAWAVVVVLGGAAVLLLAAPLGVLFVLGVLARGTTE
jgi:hypothetical protein